MIADKLVVAAVLAAILGLWCLGFHLLDVARVAITNAVLRRLRKGVDNHTTRR